MADKDLFGNELPEKPDQEIFALPDGSSISELDLPDAEEETQVAAMRSWFFENYQNPAEETPYDSGEGGYIYLYGGPFNAKEELMSRFEGVVPDEVIEKLGNELAKESWEWEGRERYDDYILETIAPPSEHVKRYTANIANIRKLITTPIGPDEEQFFRQMLYAGVIATLETYLSDRFVSSITRNPKALRNFVQTYPPFQKESMKVGDIFAASEHLERRVKSILLNEILWHRLVLVGKMFTATFGVDFPHPKALQDLLRAVEVRHDIVHRSGKNKDGVQHAITPDDITKLVMASDALVSWVDCQHDKFSVGESTQEGSGEIPI